MESIATTKRHARGAQHNDGSPVEKGACRDSPSAEVPRLSPAKVRSQVFAFINHKGGVGKTSAATHCAGAFAEAGYRVLLIDCDSQGNLSSLFLPGHEERGRCIAHLFGHEDVDPNGVIAQSVFENIWIIPSDARLNLVDETHGFEADERVYVLKEAIEDVRKRFDLILLDGSPSPHLSSYAAMVCADEIVVPCEPSVFSLEGLPSIQAEVASVRDRFNPQVRVRYFLSRVKRRGTTAEHCRRAMQEQLGEDAVFASLIPDLATYNTAINSGRHVIAHAKNSRASDYIREFAAELLQPAASGLTGECG